MPHPYLPHTASDIEQMLARCGVDNINDLYSDVPASLRLKDGYNLPESKSEMEVNAAVKALAGYNKPLVCFAGAGAYDHYTPAAVASLVARSEYLTAYTPYQPEISQGTLQYIFEYQSMMTQLTGMDVCNASMYDGATATAEAMMMAVHSAKKRRRVLVSATLDPKVADVVKTYAHYQDITIDVIPAVDGVTDRAAMAEMLATGDVAGVILQTPNYYGILEDFDGFADLIHGSKALMIVNSHASTLGVIKPAGQWGADIAVGEAQSLGIPLSYGGPYLGYMCATRALMRKMPGRIVGATTDENGQRVFVLTLQAREQHIRREKATSNICSNQGLMTLYVGIYMSLMGAAGLREVNRLSSSNAHALAAKLQATGKMSLTYPDKPFLNEFVMTLADGITSAQVLNVLRDNGILAGVAIDDNHLLIAATEKRTNDEINAYASIVKTL